MALISHKHNLYYTDVWYIPRPSELQSVIKRRGNTTAITHHTNVFLIDFSRSVFSSKGWWWSVLLMERANDNSVYFRNPPTSGENRAKPLGKQTNRMCHKPRVQTENSHGSQDTYTLPHGGHWALLRIQAWMWYQSWVLLHCDSMCNQSTL